MSTVKVKAAHDNAVQFIRHPSSRHLPFADTATEQTWPMDQFTARRLRDGDVILSDEKVTSGPSVDRRTRPAQLEPTGPGNK